MRPGTMQRILLKRTACAGCALLVLSAQEASAEGTFPFSDDQITTALSTSVAIPALSVAGGILLARTAETEEGKRGAYALAIVGGVTLGVEAIGVGGSLSSGWNQLDTLEAEARAGDGPLLQALAASLNVSPQRLATFVLEKSRWASARAEGPGTAEVLAMLLLELSPDALYDGESAGSILWTLARELQQPDFPRTAQLHNSIAAMLNVPASQVATAVSATLDEALEDLPQTGDALSRRALLNRSAARTLKVLEVRLQQLPRAN